MIKPPSRAAKAESLLCTKEGQLIRGVKIEWSDIHAGNPFTETKPWRFDETALKAGADVSGMKSTSKSGKKAQ